MNIQTHPTLKAELLGCGYIQRKNFILSARARARARAPTVGPEAPRKRGGLGASPPAFVNDYEFAFFARARVWMRSTMLKSGQVRPANSPGGREIGHVLSIFDDLLKAELQGCGGSRKKSQPIRPRNDFETGKSIENC